MPSRPTVSLALLAAAGTLCAAPATVAAAKPQAEGTYGWTSKAVSGSTTPYQIGLSVAKHKIVYVNFVGKFKKGGKLCAAQDGMAAGQIGATIDLTKHPVAPSKAGDFSFKATGKTNTYVRHKATATISGRFTNSTTATIKITSSALGCKGSISTTKAKFFQGGR